MGCLSSKHLEAAPVSAPDPAIPEPEQPNPGTYMENNLSVHVSISFPSSSCNVVDVVLSRCILVRFSWKIYHNASHKSLHV